MPFSVKFLSFTQHMFTDATTYAHFLFNAFDMDRNGSIRFEVSSSVVNGVTLYSLLSVKVS